MMVAMLIIIASSSTKCSNALISLMQQNVKDFGTQLMAQVPDNRQRSQGISFSSGRRGIFRFAVATLGVVITSSPLSAEATYSAYAAREKDWQERQEKGEIKISSASSLRKQLAEIAPMNNEAKMMFCPNGPSAAVTPMMENKCGERLAAPSVYGRTQDIVGNSIPGFNGGKYPNTIPGGVGTLNADSAGGFPSYNSFKNTGRVNSIFELE